MILDEEYIAEERRYKEKARRQFSDNQKAPDGSYEGHPETKEELKQLIREKIINVDVRFEAFNIYRSCVDGLPALRFLGTHILWLSLS